MTSAPTSRPPGTVIFCVLSHRNPEQLSRLIRTLLQGNPTAHVIIHHDAATPEPLAADWAPPGVTVLPHPRAISWGDGRDVLATLDLLRAARAAGAGWVVLLSGQDYPMRPVSELLQELTAGPYDVRIDMVPALENPGWAFGEALARYGYRHVRLGSLPGPLALATRGLAKLSRLHGPSATHPRPLLCRWRIGDEEWVGLRRRTGIAGIHTGSQWFAASASVVDAVLRHSENHPELLRSMRRCILPDEAYVQTVIATLPGLRVGPALHAVEHAGPRATTVTSATLPRFLNTGAWFCRKVDLETDAGVLDTLDALVTAPRREP